MPIAFMVELIGSMIETPLQSSTKDYARELFRPTSRSRTTFAGVGLAYPAGSNQPLNTAVSRHDGTHRSRESCRRHDGIPAAGGSEMDRAP